MSHRRTALVPAGGFGARGLTGCVTALRRVEPRLRVAGRRRPWTGWDPVEGAKADDGQLGERSIRQPVGGSRGWLTVSDPASTVGNAAASDGAGVAGWG